MAVVVIIVLAVGIYYWRYRVWPNETKTMTTQVPATLGEDIAGKVVTPADKIPNTNPYQANTNPFENTNTNPFKDVYKNPFQ